MIFKKKEIKKTEDPFDRAIKKSKAYAETHKQGTRVSAMNNNGDWKEGEIIGEPDWTLFTFYFNVKFDNGETIKQSESKVKLK